MSKQIFFIATLFLSTVTLAQKEETVEGDGTKIVKGFFTKQELASDPAFPWYIQNRQGFKPDSNAVEALKIHGASIYILAFGGTWCGDTKNLLPKFYALTEAAGLPEDHVTLIGVDRTKKTFYHLTEAFNVTNVPTFIVLKNGKEIGRVVEYGKYGLVDKEIGEIIISTK